MAGFQITAFFEVNYRRNGKFSLSDEGKFCIITLRKM